MTVNNRFWAWAHFAPDGAGGGAPAAPASGTAPAAPAAASGTPPAPAAGTKPAATATGLTGVSKPGVDNAPKDGPKDGAGDPAKPAAQAEAGTGPYKPAGVDAKYIGRADQETIDNLARQNKSLRDGLAKRGAPPESPDGYEIKLDDGLKDKVTLEGEGNQAALNEIKALAHKHGFSPQQAQGFINDVLALSVTKDWAPDLAPVDTQAWLEQEFQALGGEAQAKRRNAELQAYGAMAVERGVFTPEMKADFDLMIGTSMGVRTIEALLGMNGVKAIPLDVPMPGKKSRDELDREMQIAMTIADPAKQAQRLVELRKEFEAAGFK
jgi:hypothetical protein